jgi:hypothetical protein
VMWCGKSRERLSVDRDHDVAATLPLAGRVGEGGDGPVTLG